MSLKNQAVSGVKWNTIATAYSMMVQVIRLAVLTRLLAKADFGLVAIATMVISFTDIFSDLGITVAIIHKQDITKEQYSSVFWLNVLMSAIIFLIICALSPVIASFYNEELLLTIVPLLGIQVLLNAFGKMFQTIKTKELEFRFISIVRIVSVTIGFISTVIFAIVGWGVYSLVAGQLIQVFVNQFVYALNGLKKEKIMFHFKIYEISDMLKIGGYQLGAKFLDFVSAKIDVFLIGRFFGMDDLGVYNLAKELMLKPFHIIMSVISNVTSSAFAKLQNDISILRTNYAKLVNAIAFVAIPIYAAMFVFSDLIVDVLYADSFAEVSVFLRILSVVGMITSIDGIAGTLQVALGRTDVGMKWTIIRVIISLTSILVASFFSIKAVAYGQVIVAVICFFLYWRFAIYSLIQLKLKQYIKSVAEPFTVSIAISILLLIVLHLCKFSLFLHVLLLISAGLLYLVYYLAFNKTYLVGIIGLFTKKN